MAAGRGGLDRGCVWRKRSWTRGLWAKGGDDRRGGGRGPLHGGATGSGRQRSSGPLPGSATCLARPRCDSGKSAWRNGAHPSPCPTSLQRWRCNGDATARRVWLGRATTGRGNVAGPMMALVLALARLRCNDGAMARSVWSGGAATAARRRCATALVPVLAQGRDAFGLTTATRRRGMTAFVPAQIIASPFCYYRVRNINGSKYVTK